MNADEDGCTDTLKELSQNEIRRQLQLKLIPSSPTSTRQSLDSAAESLAFSRTSARGDVPLSWSLDRYRSSPSISTQSVGFNALSTVLNHPNKRPKALRASRYPLPAIPSVDLRLGSTSAVDNYLQDIQGEYDKFIDNINQSSASTSVHSEPELPTLDEIPRLFFKQDFDLGDPSTFDAVTKSIGDSVGLDNLESPEDIGINEILHARLEHHANAVDKILVHELSERAPSLFSALDNLHHLGNYAKEAMKKFVELRASLEQVAKNKLQIKYKTISGIVRRQDLNEILTVINDIESISHALLALQQMTELGHYFDALELVENISKTVVENIRSKDVDNVLKIESETDFTSLNVFADVAYDLEKHTSAILESISKDLAETLFIDYDSSLKNSNHNRSDLVKDVEQSICVLDRAGMLKTSLESYEQRLLKHVLQVFFELLPVDVRSKPLDLSGNLNGNLFASQYAKDLRQMQQAKYCDYLNKCREQLHVMNSSSKGQREALESISQYETLIVKLSALSSQMIEMIYSELASLIRLRKDIEAELPLNEYLEFDHMVWKLIRETEVEGSSSNSALFVLPAAASNQLQEFLELFHANYTTQSAKLVEMEVWSQAEVTPLVQKVINLIIKSAVEDIPELLHSTSITTEGDIKNESQINIEGLKFFTVEALNKVLLLLIDYLRIMLQVPNSATEIMTRIIEVLKQFNSRTCQVVLGAGAMKSAGLKNITAKHLALASQSLSVMVSLIPYIREAVRRQLKSNQTTLLIEFDRLKRDYQEHQYEIHAKLVSILGDRLTAHSKSLAATKFDKAKEEDLKKPNTYAEGLVKETATLHRVLNKYLPEATVNFVFKQVFDAINKRIGDYYQRLPVKTELGKEKLLTDAHFLCNRLNALQGIDELGSSLISIAESRQVNKTPTDSPRPSMSTDGDLAGRRSMSIDIQSRSSLERPRMSVGAASQDAIQQINEESEQSEANKEQQAGADKSLPEVPQEMLQSGHEEVTPNDNEGKANQSKDNVDVQLGTSVDELENKIVDQQGNRADSQSQIEQQDSQQEVQPEQTEEKQSDKTEQAQEDAPQEVEVPVIDKEEHEGTKNQAENAEEKKPLQQTSQTTKDTENIQTASGERERQVSCLDSRSETEKSSVLTSSALVDTELKKDVDEPVGEEREALADSQSGEGKGDTQDDRDEDKKTEINEMKNVKDEGPSFDKTENPSTATADGNVKSNRDENPTDDAKKSEQVTEVGAESDNQKKTREDKVEKTANTDNALDKTKESVIEQPTKTISTSSKTKTKNQKKKNKKGKK